MQVRTVTRILGIGLLALALTACADDASQQPMIIAATDIQAEPAAEPAAESPTAAAEDAVTEDASASTAAPAATEANEAISQVEPPAATPETAGAENAGDSPAAPAAAEASATIPPAAPAAAETSATIPPAAPAASTPETGSTDADSAAATEAAAEAAAAAPPPDAAPATPAATEPPADDGSSASAATEEAVAATAATERPAAEESARAASPAETDAAVTVAVAPVTPSAFVDSYRLAARFKIVSSNASGVVEDIDIAADGAWKRADNAFGFDASFRLESSDTGVTQVIEYVMLGDHVALRTGDGWTVSPRGAGLPIDEPVAMLDVPFVGALPLGAEVGAEEVAGVPTTHYRIDDAAEFGALVADAFGGRAGALTAIALDSWLAADGYVVQYQLAASTTGATMQDSAGADQTVDQSIEVAYSMSDIGAVEAIVWPVDAPPADALVVPGFAPNTFPLPDDAQVQPSVGVVAFVTSWDEAGVRDFYAAQLGAEGWSLEGEYGYYTARRGEEEIVLAVTAEGEGVTRVEVFAE
jgi:chemotaxis protein histidine kinase CheA